LLNGPNPPFHSQKFDYMLQVSVGAFLIEESKGNDIALWNMRQNNVQIEMLILFAQAAFQ
jgi:hypothetical protein